MFIQKGDLYAVGCQTKIAKNCQQHGEFCDSEEEAQDWVEFECWIFSGEGWICIKCNEHFMSKIAQLRKKGTEGPDDDLEVGIDTVR